MHLKGISNQKWSFDYGYMRPSEFHYLNRGQDAREPTIFDRNAFFGAGNGLSAANSSQNLRLLLQKISIGGNKTEAFCVLN